MLKPTTKFLTERLSISLILMVFLLGTNYSSYGQTTALENQSQIVEYLSDSRFNDLLESNPSYLSFLDMRCSNGYKIVDMPSEKTTGMTVLNSLTYEEWVVPVKAGETIKKSIELSSTPEEFIEDSASLEFNILKYQLAFDKSETTYYVLGSTGKVIMIYPVEYINKQLN